MAWRCGEQGHQAHGQVCPPERRASGQAWVRFTVLPFLARGLLSYSGSLPRVSGREFEIRLSLISIQGSNTLMLSCWGHRDTSVVWVA